VYRKVFETIDALASENIGVQQVRLIITAPGQTAVCEVDTVRQWAGQITYTEIVATYCADPDS
jgi:hypothetical protein